MAFDKVKTRSLSGLGLSNVIKVVPLAWWVLVSAGSVRSRGGLMLIIICMMSLDEGPPGEE